MAKTKMALSTNTMIAVAIVVSVVAILATIILGNSLLRQYTLNDKVMAKKSLADNQLKSNQTAITQLQTQYAQLGSRSDLVMSALPSKPDFSALVSMMEVIASTSGVRLKSISPPDISAEVPPASAAKNAPQAYALSALVEGSYDNVLRFLSSIELSARPLKVVAEAQTGSSPNQQVQVSLESFYQAPADLTTKTEEVK